MKRSKINRKHAAVWLFTAGLANFSSAANAGIATEDVFGGSGGSSFSLTCGADAVLVGVTAKKAAWIDAVRARCVPLDVDGKWVGEPYNTGDMAGNSTGQPWVEYTCPTNMAVKAIGGRYGSYVNWIQMKCGPVNGSGTPTQIEAKGSDQGPHHASFNYCSDGKPARGIHGADGTYVDNIGLICHIGSTPRVQRTPSNRAARNLVDANGPVSAQPTGIVRFEWRDRSRVESSFKVKIWNVATGLESSTSADAKPGRDSISKITKSDLPNGNYLFNVCARINGVDLCPSQWVEFQISHDAPGS